MSNNKIDWTKPVQTKENPPRRVNDIKWRSGALDYPVIGRIDGDLYSWTEDGRVNLTFEDNECDVENIPAPAWQLPPPPPGRQWHRVDGWTEEMLPQGYRPLMLDEPYIAGDEYRSILDGKFRVETYIGNRLVSSLGGQNGGHAFYRTTRPLPSQPHPTPPVLTQRTESILLTPPSEPIFSEATIRIKIEDEAAGEFLMFESLSNDGKLRLDPDEWPAFKAGVEFMLSEIEKHKKL
jgi:hypothetical protein